LALVGGQINVKRGHHRRPHVVPGSGQRPGLAREPGSFTHPLHRVHPILETLVQELNPIRLVAQKQTQVLKARLALRLFECGPHLCLVLKRNLIICI
jgi:hypothetical protein